MDKNIVLIGFMGAGKTVAARVLARRLKAKAVSTDELIEKKEGRPIPEIFAKSGEPYFRGLEKDIIREVSRKKNLIIDCGGGVFVDPENAALLKKHGIVIYLSATPEVLHERTAGRKHRPLLNVDDPMARIKELLAQREPSYKQAHYTLDTSHKKNSQVCDEIIALLDL